ncbi:hypothetical protein HPB49_008337 [Dermacentor silvarum]|uniref:Uncharacterized protein n=1 Tax=Dermacentor silvarum TaxID=543639 RepID=A0ACB8C8D4_DERSI|nr:hypothetical protein HPB49_008337 [Dermacentor silvarum]
MEPVSDSRRPSSDWRRYVRSTTPDASGTTSAHPGREPKLQALTNNSSRQASGDIRMEELRERHRNQLIVAVVTTACLSLNDIIRTFILWNAFTTVLIWGASCIDVFIRLIRVDYMGAAFGFTGIAALKVLLLVYIYVAYLDTLENGAAFTVPETIASRPETSASQADTLSTGNHILGLRKGSRSSATQSYASLAKHHSSRNIQPLQRSSISKWRSTDTARQSAVPLTDGLEPWCQTMGSVYNDATEEAPLQVVPNKNRVSYVWGQDVVCELKGGIQSAESSLSQQSSPGKVSFDAINMLFFGGRRKPRTESLSPPFQMREEEPNNHPLTEALTETAKAKSRENPGEAMLPPAKFNYKEYVDDRPGDPIVQEPEQVPVLITGGSETGRNSGTAVTMTTDKQLMLKEGGASEITSHDQICQHLMESNPACDVVEVNKVPGMTPTSLFDQALHLTQFAQETAVKEVIKPSYSDDKLNTPDGFSCTSVPLPSSDMSQQKTSLAFHSFNPNSENRVTGSGGN